MVDKLKVSKVGDALSIALEPGIYTRTTLRAVVTMPDIEGLELSGGFRGTVSGFVSPASLPSSCPVEATSRWMAQRAT